MVNTKSLVFELCVLQTVASLEIQKGGFKYAYSLWSTKQQHEHTHTIFSTHTSKYSGSDCVSIYCDITSA